MRRDDICIYVSPSNRARLAALVVARNTPSKVVWRAKIVLATADGHGTNEIMRRTGKSKPCVWRWQERYVEEGVDGLLRDKTRPPGKKPLPVGVKRKVLAKTASQMPPNATHCSAPAKPPPPMTPVPPDPSLATRALLPLVLMKPPLRDT